MIAVVGNKSLVGGAPAGCGPQRRSGREHDRRSIARRSIAARAAAAGRRSRAIPEHHKSSRRRRLCLARALQRGASWPAAAGPCQILAPELVGPGEYYKSSPASQLARGAARVLPPAAAAVVGRRAARRLRRRLFIIKHKMNTEWHLARSRERSLRARVSISCEANSNSPEHPRRAEPDSDGAADRAKKQTASLDRSISLLCLVVGVVSRRRAECRARLLAPCPRRLSAGLVARFRRANFH